MPHIRRQPVVTSSVLLLSLVLTACGGGGGSGSSPSLASATAGSETIPAPAPAPTPAPAPAPAPTPTDPVTPPPSPVACMPGDAPQMRAAAFSLVNVVRTAVGLPQFARLPAFDGIAQAHAQYVVANGSSGGGETAGQPCFTGVDLAARLNAAGITVNELPGTRPRSEIVIAYELPDSNELPTWDVVNNTLHTLYGRMFLLDPRVQQVGLGFSAPTPGSRRAMVLNTAVLSAGVPAAADSWVVWPRDGATGLPPRMPTSSMKPLEAGVTEGYPISLHAMAAVQVSRFVLTNASDGSAIAATVLTQANDRNGYLTQNEVALVPQAPLAAGTAYRVELDGTAGVTPVHLIWTFTTAP